MEDRKRPAISAADDIAPPSKRQAINGASKSRDDGDSKDEAWIEEYQKDAIYRQMLEYRRTAATLESQLEELKRRATYHDDHLRIVDQWWIQFLEEVELAVEGRLSVDPHVLDAASHPSSALQFKDSQSFQEHLREKGKTIKSRLNAIFSRLDAARTVKPERDLESQVKSLLASQKDLTVQLERSNSEKETLSEQLDTATLRYVKAEKKLDRAKSAQVQRLEQQALANATSRPPAAENSASEDTEANGNNGALQLKYNEAAAVAAKQKEQLAAAFAEAKSLHDEVTSLKARKDVVTDEEYARTDSFKQLKTYIEELTRRVNHEAAANKLLREENDKLQSERTAHREQLDREARAALAEQEDLIHKQEQDLTRIRAARDEHLASLAVYKAKEDQERTAEAHLQELLSAKDDRIAGLELEVERLRPRDDAPVSTPREDLESLSGDELVTRYINLEKDYELIKSEVPSVEKAYRKAMALSQKKIADLSAMEKRIADLTSDKVKTEHKYFLVRKDTDTRVAENRALRAQNSKTSDIISQLKDVEAADKAVIANLEKQMAEMKQSNIAAMEESRKLKQTCTDSLRQQETLKREVATLGNAVKSKDSGVHSSKEKVAAVESELERLKVRLEHAQAERDTWKSKTLTGTSDSEENLRKFSLCNVCNSNFKNAVLKTCGHVFCKACVDDRVANRRRKCPSCGKAFDKMDVMTIHM